MGLADRIKEATKKAEERAGEHREQIRQAAQKAGAAADQHTGGRYTETIQKASAKVDSFVDGLPQPTTADQANDDAEHTKADDAQAAKPDAGADGGSPGVGASGG